MVKERDEAQALLDAWHAYRNGTLGTIRDRYDDHDRPMDKDGLKKALEEIAAQKPPHPDDLEVSDADLQNAGLNATSPVKVPKL